jgi:hypothetical protein
MQRRKVLLTVLLALALMGLVWVGTAAASTDSSGFSEGETGLTGVIEETGTQRLAVTGLALTASVTPTQEGAHPVGLALAAYFDVLYDEIMSWHESDVGYGNIAKAYFLADTLEDEGLTAEGLLTERLSGTGWGQLMKAFGLSPSGKGRGLGQVMSGHGKDKTPPGHDKDKTPPGLEKKGWDEP